MLLLCGFGTSDAEEMNCTYGRLLKRAVEAYPGHAVRLALTSRKVIERLYQKSGVSYPDVRTALEEAAQKGMSEIRILPVQTVGGSEYEKLRELSEIFREKGMHLVMDSPLLTGQAAALADLLAAESEDAEDGLLDFDEYLNTEEDALAYMSDKLNHPIKSIDDIEAWNEDLENLAEENADYCDCYIWVNKIDVLH